MDKIDAFRKKYPDLSDVPDHDIALSYAKAANIPYDTARSELGIFGPVEVLNILYNHPYVFFGNFFVQPLPAAALAYGLVWLVMRPKGGRKIANPMLWHTCGVAVALIGSAAFRIVAMVTFAGRSAYEPAAASGAAGFYMLIVPALVAAGYFTWLKRSKLLSTSPVPPSTASSIPKPVSPIETRVAQPVRTVRGDPDLPPTTNTGDSAPVSLAVDEDAIYATIANELETGGTDKGLWTRLFAENDGDENRTKVAYIKQRAEKLNALERARLAEIEMKRRE